MKKLGFKIAAIIAKDVGIMVMWSKTDGLGIVVLSFLISWKVFRYNFIVVLADISSISNEVKLLRRAEAVLGAIRNPPIQIIGHLDDGNYPVDYEQIVKKAKEMLQLCKTYVFMEL